MNFTRVTTEVFGKVVLDCDYFVDAVGGDVAGDGGVHQAQLIQCQKYQTIRSTNKEHEEEDVRLAVGFGGLIRILRQFLFGQFSLVF